MLYAIENTLMLYAKICNSIRSEINKNIPDLKLAENSYYKDTLTSMPPFFRTSYSSAGLFELMIYESNFKSKKPEFIVLGIDLYSKKFQWFVCRAVKPKKFFELEDDKEKYITYMREICSTEEILQKSSVPSKLKKKIIFNIDLFENLIHDCWDRALEISK